MNAVPTAEGAIQLAMEELPVTIDGAKCLITGYGRVGRTLSKRLVSLGAQVTVAARKFADLAWAKSTGCETLELENLADAGDFDVIFNTVPVMLFGRGYPQGHGKETLLIDLASPAGRRGLQRGGGDADQDHLGTVPAGARGAQDGRGDHQEDDSQYD